MFIEKAAHLAVGIGYAEFSVATTDYGRSNWMPKLLLAAARVRTRVGREPASLGPAFH